MFLVGRKPKTTVFTIFFTSGNKKYGIQRVSGPISTKSISILRRFHHIRKYSFLIRTQQKYCSLCNLLNLFLRCVGSVKRKGGGRGNIKITTNLKLPLINKTIKKHQNYPKAKGKTTKKNIRIIKKKSINRQILKLDQIKNQVHKFNKLEIFGKLDKFDN